MRSQASIQYIKKSSSSFGRTGGPRTGAANAEARSNFAETVEMVKVFDNVMTPAWPIMPGSVTWLGKLLSHPKVSACNDDRSALVPDLIKCPSVDPALYPNTIRMHVSFLDTFDPEPCTSWLSKDTEAFSAKRRRVNKKLNELGYKAGHSPGSTWQVWWLRESSWRKNAMRSCSGGKNLYARTRKPRLT